MNLELPGVSFRTGKRVDRAKDPRQCFLSFERLIAPHGLPLEGESLGFQFICARLDLRDGSSARIHHGRVA
jgi:hypothetical protein